MLWIKMNIDKKKLFETQGIKNSPEYVKQVMEYRRINIKDSTDIIEYLSAKAIKTRLNCLFQRKPKSQCEIKDVKFLNIM